MNKLLALLLLLIVVGCTSKIASQDASGNQKNTGTQAADVSNDPLVKESSTGLNDLDIAQQDSTTSDQTFDDVQNDINTIDW